MGFLKPDSGQIIVAHEDITDFAEAELRRIRRKVTMVFQSGALFDSLTVAENILFSLELREDYDAKNKEESSTACSRWWISPRPGTPTPPISPPATSARSPSPAPSPRSRNASSTTSPPPWWTRSCPTTWAT